MTPPIVTKTFLCPVIGQGTEADPYRPIINAMVKRLSMAMRRLKAKPGWCIAVVTGPVDEVNKLNTQLDVRLVPNAEAAKALKEEFGEAVVVEFQAVYPSIEKIRIYPPCRRKRRR